MKRNLPLNHSSQFAVTTACRRYSGRTAHRGASGFAIGLALLVAVLSVGCINDQLLVGTVFQPAPSIPTRMVLTLTQTPLEQNYTPVANGVICRVYFFVGKNAFPVHADGEMLLTAFDTSKPISATRKPDGVYHIEAEKLSGHYRKDTIGDSYVFWLPYEPQVKSQIIFEASFTNSDGTVIKGSPISVEMEPLSNKEILVEE